MAKANATHRTISSKHRSPLAMIDVHYVVGMCALMRQALAIRHLLSMVNKIGDDEERRTLQAACHTALIHMHCEWFAHARVHGCVVLNGDTAAAKLELRTALDVSMLDERDIDAEVRLLANM
jgi:hypothetical protein